LDTSNFKVFSIVLLNEDNISPLKCQLGCIQEVIPGEDKIVRKAMDPNTTALVKRTVAKLAVLPIDSRTFGIVPLPTGGVCSDQAAIT